jgi:hypothetical protein
MIGTRRAGRGQIVVEEAEARPKPAPRTKGTAGPRSRLLLPALVVGLGLAVEFLFANHRRKAGGCS